jgi:uncharacterized protein with ParB-like and HNH nuclease domain
MNNKNEKNLALEDEVSSNEKDLELEEIPSEEKDQDLDTASYKITTYGTDFTLEILSSKLTDGEIVVPPFQRRYVWSQKKASKLVESFLLGLPVPQIFLYRNEETQDLTVVDGQQRLRTINYFLRGTNQDDATFRLISVKQEWEGKSFSDLREQDKRKFKNSILRATIFEQTDPQDDSSVFEIFERLNTGGMALTLQEIRNCVIRGAINKFLDDLNLHKSWRELLNKPSPDSRMKDVEMMLRFFALREKWTSYKKPMKDFIRDFMKDHKDIGEKEQEELISVFKSTTDFILTQIGPRSFRVKSGVNVALFDSLMVSLSQIGIKKVTEATTKYQQLLANEVYKQAISESTTDVERVQSRIKIAIETFSG